MTVTLKRISILQNYRRTIVGPKIVCELMYKTNYTNIQNTQDSNP